MYVVGYSTCQHSLYMLSVNERELPSVGQPCVVLLASMGRGGCIQTTCAICFAIQDHYPEYMYMYGQGPLHICNIVHLAVMQHNIIVQYNGNCHNINCRSGI